MTSALIIGAAIAMVAVVAVLQREFDIRSVLRWTAVTTMLLSVLLRQYGAVYGDTTLLDLLKRLLFLVTEASVVSLVMTFRRYGSFGRGVYAGVWGLAGVVGVVECVLVVVMPVHVDGTLYSYTEAGGSVAVSAYYALYEATIAATAVACSTGSVSVLVRVWLPAVTRLSLVMLTVAAGLTVVYVGVGWFSLVESPGFDYLGARHYLFLGVICLLVGGLATDGVRGVAVRRYDVVLARLGSEIVEPMWSRLTMLYPGVVLQVEPPTPMWRFLRLMIETHDAIHLIRYDTDPVIVNIINGRDPTDPRVTAELLVHLLGDSVIPGPLSWQARTMMRLRPVLRRELFTHSLIELYRLHQALTTFYDPPNPPKDHTAHNY